MVSFLNLNSENQIPDNPYGCNALSFDELLFLICHNLSLIKQFQLWAGIFSNVQ